MSDKKPTYLELIKAQNDLVKKLDLEAKGIAKTLHDNRDARRAAIVERQRLDGLKKAEKSAELVKKAEALVAKKIALAEKAQKSALALQESAQKKAAGLKELTSKSGKTVAKAAAKSKKVAPAPDLVAADLEAELKATEYVHLRSDRRLQFQTAVFVF
jgi:hypothetical protein